MNFGMGAMKKLRYIATGRVWTFAKSAKIRPFFLATALHPLKESIL